MSEHYPLLIIGAGLSGLSLAYHRSQNDYLLVEKEKEAGGLARSLRISGFVFDYSGHALHLRDSAIRKLVNDLLADNLISHNRRVAVYLSGRFIPYPIQQNYFLLPSPLRRLCWQGVGQAFAKGLFPFASRERRRWVSYRDYIRRNFGYGLGKYFFIPYHRKLFQDNLNRVYVELPVSVRKKFIPQAALFPRTFPKRTGYNPVFLYPREGGIQVLSESFLRGLSRPPLFNAPLERIFWKQKEAVIGGRNYTYQKIVATLPLPSLLTALVDPPRPIAEECRFLRANQVLCLALGINHPISLPYHWVYFPEQSFLFYRLCFPDNFSPQAVPPGKGALMIEISRPPGVSPYLTNEEEKQLWENLKILGLLNTPQEIVFRQDLLIPYGYVLPDIAFLSRKKVIFDFLKLEGIFPAGRYGSWRYSFMEEDIREGKELARLIET